MECKVKERIFNLLLDKVKKAMGQIMVSAEMKKNSSSTSMLKI